MMKNIDKGQGIGKRLVTMSRNDLLDTAETCKVELQKINKGHVQRSHYWRVMTLCKIKADGFSTDTMSRLAGAIPSNDKQEHVKRCAFLVHFLGVNNKDRLSTDSLINIVQPWFCRDWKKLARIDVQTSLAPPLQGHKGSAWSIGWRLEVDELAGEDVTDLSENLSQACLFQYYEKQADAKWIEMVSCGLDSWQQRTGKKLSHPPLGYIIRPNAKQRGWKKPRINKEQQPSNSTSRATLSEIFI